MFIKYLTENPPFFISTVVVVIFSICMHECAHAWAALRQGDTTAADNGHLTLNPVKQMGPLSLFMVAFIGIAWGAVPVNPARMRHKYSHALVAFAGPATNIILAVIFLILIIVVFRLPQTEMMEMVKLLVIQGAALNIVLFIFNMLPIPILDGWTIFSYFIPAMDDVPQDARNAIFFLLFIGFFFFGTRLFEFAYFLVGQVVPPAI